MKKIVRLTESDLIKIVKRVLNEQWVGPGDKLDFQPCVKKLFGDNVIDLKMTDGTTYKAIKGTGDWANWYFYKGNTAWNPKQQKMVPFTCAGENIILSAKEDVTGKGAQMVTDQDTDFNVIKSGEKVIGMGAKGPLVKSLQGALSKLGYGDPTAVGGNPNCSWEDGGASCDGKFGKATRKALIDFQRRFGISADGIFGKEAYQLMYQKRATKGEVV